MTAAARWLLLPVLAVALFLSGMAPAQAGYTASRPLTTMSFGTLKVAAPTGLTVAGSKCVTTYDSTTGTSSSTLQARVDWAASATTRGVTGYVISAVFADGSKYPVASTNAATTSMSGSYDISYASQNIRVTVTTTTSYGWTAETAPSGVIKC